MKKQSIFKNESYHHSTECDCRMCVIKEVKSIYTIRGFLMALFWFMVLVMVGAVVGTYEFNNIIEMSQ